MAKPCSQRNDSSSTLEDLFKALSFITSLHFRLIASPIAHKNPLQGSFFCYCCSGGSMYQHKDITNLDMLSFSRFSRHSATVIWFYMFVFPKRMMKIVAMIPGLRALCATWGEPACIFCASASCAVFCLPVCQDSLETLYRAAFSNHPDMQHKAAQLSLISILPPRWTLP